MRRFGKAKDNAAECVELCPDWWKGYVRLGQVRAHLSCLSMKQGQMVSTHKSGHTFPPPPPPPPPPPRRANPPDLPSSIFLLGALSRSEVVAMLATDSTHDSDLWLLTDATGSLGVGAGCGDG